MDTALAAITYCWHLESQSKFQESAKVSGDALAALETFRDSFAVRKYQKAVLSSKTLPNVPIDQAYPLFEKWIECLHVDLLTVWIQCQLKHNLNVDTESAHAKFLEDKIQKEKDRKHEEELYGSLDAHQRTKYEALLNRPFAPPIHAKGAEVRLLEQFRSNYAAKALIYVQMAFFRPKRAGLLLEKARDCIKELGSLGDHSTTTSIIYATRTEIGLAFHHTMPDAKTVAVFGKENVGQTGLTLSNTSLQGTGVKQEQTEPFIITQLRPNTLYTFAFGGFDRNSQLVDSLLDAFSVATCHSLSVELVWCYIASASFQLNDHKSFDLAMSFLIER
jgi:hypothetical protein